jgi:hypothetical protein
MRFKKTLWLAGALLLSACNIGINPPDAPTPDVNAIFTSAADTMIAQFSEQQTQTAQAVPPTPLPSPTALPSFTPLPTFPGGTPFGAGSTPFGAFTPLGSAPAPVGSPSGPLCNDSAFVTETYPDGSKLKPGEDFKKVWAVQNVGTCMWDDGYVFTFAAGDDLDGYNVPIEFTKDFVKPGEVHNFAVNLTAHLALGTYQGCWKMKDDHGYFFGSYFCVVIEVVK